MKTLNLGKNNMGDGEMMRDADKSNSDQRISLDSENKFLSLEQNFNYFTAILTGSNFWPRRHTGAVARAYLEYDPRQQSLHISVTYKGLSGKPTVLEVIDPAAREEDSPMFSHRINHEKELRPGRKICVTWDEVKAEAVEKLSSQVLFMSLKTEVYKDGEIKGIVGKHRALLRG